MSDIVQPWVALDHVERNYDAGRPMSTFAFFFADIPMNIAFIPQLPSIAGLMNGLLGAGVLLRYAARAEDHFRSAVARHKAEVSAGQFSTIVSRDDLEAMIYFMKRSIDLLVQLYCMKFSAERSRVKVESLGEALTLTPAEKIRHSELAAIFFGDSGDRHSDSTKFLTMLNDVSNSYKHGLLLPESDGFRALEFPNVVLFEYKRNKFDKTAIVHNHNAYHVVMGFQDAIRRILKNAGDLPVSWPGPQYAS